MKTKTALLTLAIILSLVLAAVPAVFASEVRTIPYQYFNNQMTFFKLNYNYTNAWTVYITNYLTYNTTTAGKANLRLHPANTSVYKCAIELNFDYDGDLFVYYADDAGTIVGIGSGKWVSGEAVVVSVSADGIINVGNKTDKDYIVKNYGAGSSAIDLYYVGAASDTGTAKSIATAGYINIEVYGSATGTTDISSLVMVWIPVIVTFVMLGVVLGFVKKIGS